MTKTNKIHACNISKLSLKWCFRVFMQPLKHFGFNHGETTSTTSTSTQTPDLNQIYKDLSPEECRERIDEDTLPPMEPWFFYPEKSECYHFAIWEHFQLVNWKPKWFQKICDETHEKHQMKKARELRKILKETHCNSGN